MKRILVVFIIIAMVLQFPPVPPKPKTHLLKENLIRKQQ